MKTKTVYYAHPMALYGTLTECGDIAILRTLGFKVLNPALKEYADLPMDDYVKLAQSCDLVAFRAFEDGKIGAGVAKEIEGAMAKGVPVIELPTQILKRVLTRNETRARMGLPKLRHPETAPFRAMSDDPIRSHLGWDDEFADQDWGAS